MATLSGNMYWHNSSKKKNCIEIENSCIQWQKTFIWQQGETTKVLITLEKQWISHWLWESHGPCEALLFYSTDSTLETCMRGSPCSLLRGILSSCMRFKVGATCPSLRWNDLQSLKALIDSLKNENLFTKDLERRELSTTQLLTWTIAILHWFFLFNYLNIDQMLTFANVTIKLMWSYIENWTYKNTHQKY